MAEPAGLLIEIDMTEAELASFFRRSVKDGSARLKVGHLLSRWLDEGDEHGNVLIVHHDAERQRLFFGWLHNHYAPEVLDPAWPLLDVLAQCVAKDARCEGAVATTLSHCLRTIRIVGAKVEQERGSGGRTPAAEALMARLWSFARKDSFPDPAASMRRRDYQCKPFRRAWKSYLSWRDEQERPARIAAATAENPYHLVGPIYCWPGFVIHRDGNKRDHVIPQADPLTLRWEGEYWADRSHVWEWAQSKASPSAEIATGAEMVPRREVIRELRIVPGVDGGRFRWLFDKAEPMYWTDETHVYARGPEGLAPLPDLNAAAIREYGWSFITDGVCVYRGDTRLPLALDRMQTERFFIWDDEKVFYGTRELPLTAKGFRLLGRQPDRAGLPRYRLTDGEKTIILEPGGSISPDEPDFEDNPCMTMRHRG